MRKMPDLVVLALFLVSALACNLSSPLKNSSSTPAVLADTFFSGHAYLDVNKNGELDADDPPLEGARFSCAGFGSQTGADGVAVVVIPGGWDKPVEARMEPPEGSAYTLIAPTAVTLQSPGKTRADFLFAIPTNLPAGQTASVATPAALQVDLTYCTTTDGVKLTMDLYQPKKIGAPAPVVLYVHGGGWTGGDKSDGAGLLFKEALVLRGFAMAAINYRLGPKYVFPAQIEDVKCAVRHLRANASKIQPRSGAHRRHRRQRGRASGGFTGRS